MLFNRFLHPDIDPETARRDRRVRAVQPGRGTAAPGLDRPAGGPGAGASLAASTGVEDAADVAAYLLAGADVVMTTSALLRHGPEHATVLLDGLTDWMTRKGFPAWPTLRGKLASSPARPRPPRSGPGTSGRCAPPTAASAGADAAAALSPTWAR